ncbi:MAG: outer membrane lipoprotein carrier protein LolA [Desulfuromonadaceae bacterium]|nr:outer membrane lipoprotein carrier protein LolA [Desulfuromonadaceae bacterium]MDD2855674.1 outer membrane lipoprotein carrier protein LolA [Desulfuromonadaceae bacterium]
MFRLNIIALFLSALTLPSLATGAPVSLKEIVSSLETGYADLQDVQADFSQKTTIASINRQQKGSGEVFLKRPASSTAKFRFDYTKPKQQIISNGKQVWFYTPENRQVLVSDVTSMFSGGNSIALSYLTGLGHVSQDFNITMASAPEDKNGNYQLELIPKKPGPVLVKLELTISNEAVLQFRSSGRVKNIFPVVSSVVHDAGGNTTRIDYNRTRVNKGLSDAKFNFKIPEGVEVIKP